MTTPKTASLAEEISVVESMGTTSVPEPKSPEIKKTFSQLRNTEAIRWRPKTRPSNKFHLNIKKILNPRFKKESTIEMEQSSSEEDVQSKKIEGMISQALESI